MRIISTFYKLTIALVVLLSVQKVQAQAISEGFDNVSALPAAGWSLQNLSSPLGSTGWLQGNPAVFTSQNGANNSYIAADINNTNPGASSTISNWLLTPSRTLKNGDVVTFYTRTTGALLANPDRLQVRMSTAGTSTNVGSSATSVGDFTTLLLEINPSQSLLTYPTTFTQYTITISGLTAPTAGRLAFRYFVTNASSGLGGNGTYIGIDNFVYTPLTCPAITINPTTVPAGTAGTAYPTTTFTQSGGTNPTTYAITSGALPAGLTLSSAGVLSGTPTASGTFSFTVTGTNTVTGCSGSRAYTLTINCPASNVTLAPFTAVCADAAPVTLTGGSPAGGTYSGTGVSNGMFNPASGTQTITYTVMGSFGCTNSASQVFTVTPNPVITFGTLPNICSDALPMTLSNASPAGGTYSGTGVSNNQFAPSAGTQTVTYTVSVNGCSSTASQTVTVNMAPTVTLDSVPSQLCAGAMPIQLTGGMPAGGMYGGSNVSNDTFNPANVGFNLVSYTYVAPNGCPAYATRTIDVIICYPAGVEAQLTAATATGVLLCYPNPSTGTVAMLYTITGTHDIDIQLVNMQGTLIQREELKNVTGSLQKTYDLNNLPKGIYILQVSNGESRTFQKIILQ